jgi:hypothetical protein
MSNLQAGLKAAGTELLMGRRISPSLPVIPPYREEPVPCWHRGSRGMARGPGSLWLTIPKQVLEDLNAPSHAISTACTPARGSSTCSPTSPRKEASRPSVTFDRKHRPPLAEFAPWATVV